MLKLVDVSKGEKIRLFNNIGIEISSKCNRTCFFCPNHYFDRKDEQMDIALIDKMLSELRDLKYTGRIEWYIYNEPTRHAELDVIIARARKIVPKATQMINTNGDYFKSAVDIKNLFNAGLNQMQINIYSSNDGKDEKRFKIGVELAKKRHELLQCWVDSLPELNQKLSLYQNIGSNKKACQVIAKYGVKVTTADSEVEGPNHFSNRSGAIPGFRNSVTEPLKKHCTRPFRFLNINWNGDALLCCNDYYGQATFGNVKEQSLVEIWNDVNLHIYRLKLQNKQRDCFLCNNCDFDGGYYPHMIDNVTFGVENDKQILAQDLSNRETIFGKSPLALSVNEQGTPRKQK